jgi:hypothetical protein
MDLVRIRVTERYLAAAARNFTGIARRRPQGIDDDRLLCHSQCEVERRCPSKSRSAGTVSISTSGLTQRLRRKTDSEHGLFGFVEQFHVPFRILLEAARNAAEKVAANLRHLGLRRFAALKFRWLIGGAGIAAMADPEKIQRHCLNPCVGPPLQPVDVGQTGSRVATKT